MKAKKRVSKNAKRSKKIDKNKDIFTIIVVLTLFSMLLFFSGGRDGEAITGDLTMLDIAPKGYVFVEPDDVSKESAELAIENAQNEITDMRSRNFVTFFADDALLEAKGAFEKGDYVTVLKLTQLISYTKKERVEFFDKVKLIEAKKQVLEEKGVKSKDLANVNALMQQALGSLNLEQFDDANSLLDEAREELRDLSLEHSRVKTLSLLSKNFFVRYWWQSLIVLLILLAFSPLIFNKVHGKLLSRKISHLKLELAKSKDLIKDLQKERFVSKTITGKAYELRVSKYEDRISEIKRLLPVFTARLKKSKSSNIFKKIWGLLPWTKK